MSWQIFQSLEFTFIYLIHWFIVDEKDAHDEILMTLILTFPWQDLRLHRNHAGATFDSLRFSVLSTKLLFAFWRLTHHGSCVEEMGELWTAYPLWPALHPHAECSWIVVLFTFL